MDNNTLIILILGLLVVLIIGGGFVMSLENQQEDSELRTFFNTYKIGVDIDKKVEEIKQMKGYKSHYCIDVEGKTPACFFIIDAKANELEFLQENTKQEGKQ